MNLIRWGSSLPLTLAVLNPALLLLYPWTNRITKVTYMGCELLECVAIGDVGKSVKLFVNVSE